MKIVKYNTVLPEETVAFDELLLLKAESGEIGETLRIWGSKECFVVIGRAGKVSEEAILGKCESDKVKVIRRISGGGTVLQGPGCINYSLVLSYDGDTKYRDIRASYESILGGLARNLKKTGEDVQFFPISDIALGDKKISGNAQARKKKYFLHHGTLLISFDLEKIPCYLKYPPREPEYRRGRSHEDFLVNIAISEEKLEKLLRETFSVKEESWSPSADDLKELKNLVDNKYGADEWNYAF